MPSQTTSFKPLSPSLQFKHAEYYHINFLKKESYKFNHFTLAFCTDLASVATVLISFWEQGILKQSSSEMLENSMRFLFTLCEISD